MLSTLKARKTTHLPHTDCYLVLTWCWSGSLKCVDIYMERHSKGKKTKTASCIRIKWIQRNSSYSWRLSMATSKHKSLQMRTLGSGQRNLYSLNSMTFGPSLETHFTKLLGKRRTKMMVVIHNPNVNVYNQITLELTITLTYLRMSMDGHKHAVQVQERKMDEIIYENEDVKQFLVSMLHLEHAIL